MTKTKNKLYLFLFIACILGYTWLFIHLLELSSFNEGLTTCLFKKTTTLPCPSCGSTRSILLLINGNFKESWLTNPLGWLISFIMLILPFWILYDWITKKDSFFLAYKKTEKILQKPLLYIPLVILILVNWVWNIYKNL